MSLNNLFRNSRKTTMVILSISLSFILFLTVYTVVQGFNIDKYIQEKVAGDFFVTTQKLLTNYEVDPPLSDESFEYINALEGITDVEELWISIDEQIPALHHPELGDELNLYTSIRYGFGEHTLDRLTVLKGEIDYKKFSEGGYVLLVQEKHSSTYTLYQPGDIIETFHFSDKSEYKTEILGYDENKNAIEFTYYTHPAIKRSTIMAVVEMPYNISSRSYVYNSQELIFDMDTFRQQEKKPMHYGSVYSVEEMSVPKFEENISQYASNKNPKCGYESKAKIEEDFNEFRMVVVILGGTMTLIIAIIALLNFSNSIITNVITRRREFALLRSIGMDTSQIHTMIIWECFFYILFACILSAVLGTILSAFGLHTLLNDMTWFSYEFTMMPFLYYFPILIIIAALLPINIYNRINSGSLIEQLREIY